MKSIQVKVPGGPEKMELVEVPKPTPGSQQALVRIAASGVNFIDVYFRTGLYKADIPITLGSEGAGTVETVGADVTEVVPGDRVAYAMARGSYAEYALVPAALLVKIRRYRLPDRRGRHAPGHDGSLPDALHLCAQERRYLPGSRGGGRRRRADGPDGQDAGRARVRHRFHRRESPHRAPGRRGRNHPLHRAGFRSRSEAFHRRPRGGRGVRLGGQDDLREKSESLRPRGLLALFGQSSERAAFDPTILNGKGCSFSRPAWGTTC